MSPFFSKYQFILYSYYSSTETIQNISKEMETVRLVHIYVHVCVEVMTVLSVNPLVACEQRRCRMGFGRIGGSSQTCCRRRVTLTELFCLHMHTNTPFYCHSSVYYCASDAIFFSFSLTLYSNTVCRVNLRFQFMSFILFWVK